MKKYHVIIDVCRHIQFVEISQMFHSNRGEIVRSICSLLTTETTGILIDEGTTSWLLWQSDYNLYYLFNPKNSIADWRTGVSLEYIINWFVSRNQLILKNVVHCLVPSSTVSSSYKLYTMFHSNKEVEIDWFNLPLDKLPNYNYQDLYVFICTELLYMPNPLIDIIIQYTNTHFVKF